AGDDETNTRHQKGRQRLDRVLDRQIGRAPDDVDGGKGQDQARRRLAAHTLTRHRSPRSRQRPPPEAPNSPSASRVRPSSASNGPMGSRRSAHAAGAPATRGRGSGPSPDSSPPPRHGAPPEPRGPQPGRGQPP